PFHSFITESTFLPRYAAKNWMTMPRTASSSDVCAQEIEGITLTETEQKTIAIKNNITDFM
ncbi:MAG: hypothetical protein ACREDR_47400, partial [Blastocatellia bacterium]